MTKTYYCTSTLDDHATIETIEADSATQALDFFEATIKTDQPVEIRSLEAWDMADKAKRTITV